jgi:hypothetical protein
MLHKNKNIVEQPCSFHARKVFEENVCCVVGYHFFFLIKLIYEKGNERVLFKCFSDYLNMKNP